MAVYERHFSHYEGPRTSLSSRFWVIARYAFKEVTDSRLFLISLVVAYVMPVINALVIYLKHNLDAISILQLAPEMMPDLGGEFYLGAMLLPQQWLALWMTLLIGPTLITRDLAGGAMPLYLSRPLNRRTYALGKASVLLSLLSAITWIPALLLWLFHAYLEGGSWAASNIDLAVTLFVSSWIWILMLTCMALALSAWVKWKAVARLVLLGALTVPAGFGRAMNEILDLETDWGALISPADLVSIIRANMFGDRLPEWVHNNILDVPIYSAWLVIGFICLACLGLLARKIQAYEVVG